jgi:hypothetical protein
VLFGSCHSQHYFRRAEQKEKERGGSSSSPPLWPAMSDRNATAFVWTGDAVYADDFTFEKGGRKRPKDATPDVQERLWAELLELPEYKHFTRRQPGDGLASRKPAMTVLGVFDDHDYGSNNGDRRYRYKRESAVFFTNFLRKSSGDATDLSLMEQRAAAGMGVYGAKLFDYSRPVGQELLSDAEAGLEPATAARQSPVGERTVAVFLLDCRSNKTPWKQSFPERLFPDYAGDFLGPEQWEWFEVALSRSTATVNIVVQGLQVHPDRFYDGNIVEDWSRFPTAQHRLYQTILQSGVSAPVLVSGDVHMAEKLRKDCRKHSQRGNDDFGPARLLLEVTTSGLTHSWGSGSLCARPASAVTCRMPHFQRSLTAGMHLAHINHAWTDVVDVKRPHEAAAKRRYQYTLKRNFGEFEFDWEKQRLIIRIFGEKKGVPLLSTAWDFELLSNSTNETTVPMSHYAAEYQELVYHGVAAENDWICVAYGGRPSFLLKFFGFVSPVALAAAGTLSPIFLVAFVVYYFITRIRKKTNKKSKSE